MTAETDPTMSDDDRHWRDYVEEKAYQTALGEMIMTAGYTERAAHQLAWAVRSLDVEAGTSATGCQRFADLRRDTIRYANELLPAQLSSLVRYSFQQAAPYMRRRNALVHASWVSSQPRIRLSTRDVKPHVVELSEIEELASYLLAAGFQFGVAQTQVFQWQGKTPMEEEMREIMFLDRQLRS